MHINRKQCAAGRLMLYGPLVNRAFDWTACHHPGTIHVIMRAGLDIGSTTIKCVVLDDDDRIIYSDYERHYSHIVEKSVELLKKAYEKYTKDEPVWFAVSGSAGMGLADRCGIGFVQEVFADRIAAKRLNPGTDCIIELGGEDAKIVFLSGGSEVRMNGSCAGGTGAFIDQMATLLNISSSEMDEKAGNAQRTYTIASRCGVFAKSDIQPLLNQGAQIPDLCASIYQAVVNQTIAGLAQGREISGNVLYLGGPLTFSSCLRKCFDRTLHITGICPENSLYYVAMGAAFYADSRMTLKEAAQRIREHGSSVRYASLEPLFADRDEYWDFHLRHAKASVPRVPFDESCGRVHIGIDSGSTTIKMAVIDEKTNILFTDYCLNEGSPVQIIRSLLLKLYREHPGLKIGSVSATGYGESLIMNAFRCDFGVVETEAHYMAARHFMPDVDFIIDIGGQDMKCFRIENRAISDIFLNEACSSGCGSFLQTFARALNMETEEFAMQGLFAKHPVDLGSRCTVFMNSSVKQAQKDGAPLDCISAGLSISIVKNALYKVIRASSPEELGRNIVVQGGTFYNEAVLRAFEKEIGINVIRPDIAGLMGAYGAALYGMRRSDPSRISSVLSENELESFTHSVQSVKCSGCGNHCQLTVNTFQGGKRFISGNRCEKPVTGKKQDSSLNLYQYKLQALLDIAKQEGSGRMGTIAVPLVLNMFELFPFWHRLFTELGFRVILSPVSDRVLYQSGQTTIPSDTVCFPAKLTHGHIHALANADADMIFYPCMSYNIDEHLGTNHYNCPVVAYYPEVLAGNCGELKGKKFFYEYVSLSDRDAFSRIFPKLLRKYEKGLKPSAIRKAISKAYEAYDAHMNDICAAGEKIIRRARSENRRIIVLAGRPYHIDPEISHGIDRLITAQGAAVVTEDSVSRLAEPFEVSVLNQWTYHSRLYAAAKYCTENGDTDLIQLVSFGCGLDAITSDEVREILQSAGKLYTQLKIDEITNTGTANIRIRSLFAALQEKQEERG